MPVLLCWVSARARVFGDRAAVVVRPTLYARTQTSLFQLYYSAVNVALSDVMTLGRLTGFLQAKREAFTSVGEPNQVETCGWAGGTHRASQRLSMRLLGRAFPLERNAIRLIKDAQNPSEKSRGEYACRT